MQLLLAKPVKEELEQKIQARVAAFKKNRGRAPKLAVVIVGNDPASLIYTKKKGEEAVRLGMEHVTHALTEKSSPNQLYTLVDALNRDSTVDGILIQRPLPKSFKEEDVVYWILPEKDIDAFHPLNAGRLSLGLPGLVPCTPTGVMRLLKHYGIALAGKTACVIGRSSIVGKPMAALLLQADATVIQCHSKTTNLEELTRTADLLIVAAGKPGLIGAKHIRAGAVVVDVGIHRTSDGKIVGDVVYEEVLKKASALTPVPGGVGPMTIAQLLLNTVIAAEKNNADK
ncbi:MAG: bifunctional 5,10-methylenetetrahydrofolate dehydrogenase/5,10-methenyltetrahydrofolate cyclohydrolase [Bdellovibrionota bacterium]